LLDEDSPAGQAERTRAGEHLNQHVRREFNIPGVTFAGRYDASAVIVRDGTTPPPDAANSYTPSASPGGRPPHAWLADGRSLFDSFHSEWTLLQLDAEGDDASELAAQAFVAAAAVLQMDLKVVRHAVPELQALYEAPLALIRPDQIVAWRGHDALRAGSVLAQASGRSVAAADA
jgi:hypothetical protein